jgi:hypothetical protein
MQDQDSEFATASSAPPIDLAAAKDQPDTGEAKEYPHSLKELTDMLEDGKKHWSEPHKKYADMLAFSHGEEDKQWDSEALTLRRASKRVALQYPIVSAFIRPTVNAVSEAPPSISVFPISDATKEDAQLVAGLFRYIQTRAQAERAYLYALDRGMRATISGFRIMPKKVRRKIEIEITPIVDMTKYFIDPAAQAMDYSDAQWIIVETSMSERDYKHDFPNGTQNAVDGKVTVYEAWIIEELEDEDSDGFDEDANSAAVKLHIYIFEPLGILDYVKDYEGTIMPFFFLAGERVDIDGKTTLRCVTDDLIAPQRAINWLESESISVMASAPKALFMAPEDSLGDYQEDWENSAVDPMAILMYKGGEKPTQIMPPPPPSGYLALSQENIERARLITGVYPDPTLQAKADAPSGKAIKQQQMGSGVAMYHWVSALNNLLACAGECLLEMAVKYLNNNQLRISMSADGTPIPVSFGPTLIEGVKNVDLSKVKLGCTFSAGPSYASQREALMDRIMTLGEKQPEMLSVVTDWIISQANLPGSEEIIERIQELQPDSIKQIIKQRSMGDPKAVMGAMHQALEELSTQRETLKGALEQTTEALNKTQQELATLKASKDQENETKLQIASIDSSTKLQIADQNNATDLEKAHLSAFGSTLSEHLES